MTTTITGQNRVLLGSIALESDLSLTTSGVATLSLVDGRYLPIVATYNGTTVGVYSDNHAAYSVDQGVSSHFGLILTGTQGFRSVVYQNGLFQIASNANVHTSSDGITWSTEALPNTRTWTQVAGDGVSTRVIVAQNSSVAAYDSGSGWTEVALPSSKYWNSVVWTGSKFLVNSKTSGDTAVSTDGITWTTGTSITEPGAYGNGQILTNVSGTLMFQCNVANYDSRYAHSNDHGTTWTYHYQPCSSQYSNTAMCYTGSNFITVNLRSSDPRIIISESIDGLSWVNLYSGTPLVSPLYVVEVTGYWKGATSSHTISKSLQVNKIRSVSSTSTASASFYRAPRFWDLTFDTTSTSTAVIAKQFRTTVSSSSTATATNSYTLPLTSHRRIAFPDLHWQFADPVLETGVVFGSDYVWFSDDSGTTWSKGAEVYGCTMDDAYQRWNHTKTAFASNNKGQLIAVVNRTTGNSATNNYLYSLDCGLTWSTTNLYALASPRSLYQVAYNSITDLFIAYNDNFTKVYYTGYASDPWTEATLTTTLTNHFLTPPAVASGHGNVIVMGRNTDNKKIVALYGDGVTMTEIEIHNFGVTGFYTVALEYISDNTFRSIIYSNGTAVKFYQTTNGGSTWFESGTYSLTNTQVSTPVIGHTYNIALRGWSLRTYSVLSTALASAIKSAGKIIHTIGSSIGSRILMPNKVGLGNLSSVGYHVRMPGIKPLATSTSAGEIINNKWWAQFCSAVSSTTSTFDRLLHFTRTFIGFGTNLATALKTPIKNCLATLSSAASRATLYHPMRNFTLTLTSNDNNAFGNITVGNTGLASEAITSFSANALSINGNLTIMNSAIPQMHYANPDKDIAWTAHYSMYNDVNGITSIQDQLTNPNPDTTLSQPHPANYYKNTNYLPLGAQIIEDVSLATLTTFSVNVSATSASIDSMSIVSSSEVSSSYSSGTLHITGTKGGVNNALVNLTVVPITNNEDDYYLKYEYTSPDTTIKATRLQKIRALAGQSISLFNAPACTIYTKNITNTGIFADYWINESAAASDIYTFILTLTCGTVGPSLALSSSQYSFTGSKTEVNTAFGQLHLYPITDVFGNQTFTITCFKNGTQQFNQVYDLIGVA